MINLTSWVTRLQAVSAGVGVELIADTKAAEDTAAIPAIFLCHGRNRVSHANAHPASARHRVNAEVILVSVCARENQNLAGGVRDALTDMRQPLLTSLINWLPDDADTPIKWHGGQLLNIDNTAIFWGDVLSVDFWFSH